MKYALVVAALTSMTLAQSAIAHGTKTQSEQSTTQGASATAGAMADGEVRKVDKDAGKITMKHGPIPNLEMPGMTMVFRVKDAAMLDQVKAGDKVRFAAEKVGGQFTVTQIEPTK